MPNLAAVLVFSFFCGLIPFTQFIFHTHRTFNSGIRITGFADEENYPTSISIPSSIDGKPVTYVGGFSSCTELTSVYIPSSVTSIGSFSGCTSLTSINITSSVTKIDSSAFRDCTSLTSVGDLSSVTSIGSYAFENCTSLTSMGDLSSVTTIGCQAFRGCTTLTSIGDLSSVTSIDYSAFSGCTSLTSVGDLSSATDIEMYTFSGCTALKSVGNLSSATFIGKDAFKGCKSLTSVGDLSSAVTIGQSAFENCAALTSIGDLSSVITIKSSAFLGCTSLTSMEGLSSVTTINSSAFEGCTSLTSMGDLSSVTYIGSTAFEGCTSLTSIGDLSSLTSIEYKVFYGCTALTSIGNLSSAVTIGQSAFENCKSLTSIGNLSYVTSIGSSAFSCCTALTEIDIPSSVTSIGSSAFKGCTALTEIDIPSSVTTISSSTFEGCTALTSIVVPSSVNSIYDHAFKDCTSLTSVYIPSSFTSIDCNYSFDFPFENCSSLEYLNCNSDDCMNEFYFYSSEFYNLKTITAGQSCTEFCTKNGVLYNKDMTKLLWVPSMLECENDTFVIPETVQTVGSDAFNSICKIKNVYAFDNANRTLSYFNSFGKHDDAKIPEEKKKYYYAGTKPSVTDDWEAIDLTPEKDKVINNYTIQVIDGITGEKYNNVTVQTDDEKYSVKTDANGMAVFEIDEEDSAFWDIQHVFNVKNSASDDDSIVSASFTPTKDNLDTILVSQDLITDIRFNDDDVKMARHHVKPQATIGKMLINEVYDTSDLSGDKLTVTFKDKIVGKDWKIKIVVTDAEFAIENNGNKVYDKYGNLVMNEIVVVENQSITKKTMTFNNFSDLISKQMQGNSNAFIGPGSRIKITVFQSGASIENWDNHTFYLKCAPVVYNKSSSAFGIFDASKFSSAFGKFSASPLGDVIPNLDFSMYADLTENTVGFEAQYGLYEHDNEDVFARLSRRLYGDDIYELYRDYPEAISFKNKDGSEVTNLAEYASSPDTFNKLKEGMKNFDKSDLKKIASGIKGTEVEPVFDFYAAASGKGKIDKTTITLSGDIGLGATFGVEGKYMIPQLANLAYISGSIIGETSIKAEVDDLVFTRVQYQDAIEFQKINFDPKVKAGFGVTAEIGAGVGVGDVIDANITAALTGETTYDMSDFKWKDASVGGNITLNAKLLCWENSHELMGVKATIIDENGNPDDYIEYNIFGKKHNNRESGAIEEENNGSANGASETISASDFKLVRRSGNEISTGISEELLGVTETSVSTEIIAQNVYAVSDPVIVSAGGSEYLFRFIDDTSRSAANCSKLVYSKKTDGVWSDPIAIADNSTADFDASVCTDGNDIYIAWCDIGSVLSDSSLYTDAITASTISAVKLDAASDTITELGTVSVSGKSNLSPSIAVRNGSGIVTWVSNADPDPLTNTGNDEVYYSVISNDSLGSPKKYASSGANKLIGTAQAGYIGSKLCIVYSSAESGGKAETSELYGSVYTGTPVQLTSNEFADTRPQFEKLNGEDVMFWYYGGTILYTDSLGGEVNAAVTGLIDDRYAIASSGDVTKIAWRARNDEEQDIMKMASYENGEFTHVYTGNKLGFNPSMINAVIDSAGNMQAVYTYKNGAQTDLAITAEVESPAVDVRYARVGGDYVSGDEKVPLSVNIHNSGNRNLTDITINISDSAGNIVASYPTELDIEIGEIADYEFEAVLPIPEAATAYTVSVEGAESDTAEFVIGYAAMYLEGETYEAGKQRFANIICRNDSNISSGGFLMTYIDGELVSVTEISSIDSSASSLSQFNLTELAGSNDFTAVEFVLDGTKPNSTSGVTKISYEYDEIIEGVTTAVAEGVDAVLTADNDDNAASYLWQVNTGNGWEDCTESGNTSEKLTISAVTSAYDGYVYRCTITNADGSTVYSTSFELDVISAESVTEEMVDNMTVSQCAQFVNGFTADTEDTAYVLTAAQMKAVERVLDEDYK